MSVFLLSAEDNERIARAAAEAIKNPITLTMLMSFGKRSRADDFSELDRSVGDRPADVPEPQVVLLSFGWRLNISCEQQPEPVGLCLHLSMSSPTPEKSVPRMEAMGMVLEALGHDLNTQPFSIWLEAYREGDREAGRALNMLVPIHAKACI